MLLAIPFPEISPNVFSIEIGGFAFALRWYALSYIAAILAGWWIARRLMRAPELWPGNSAPMTKDQVDDLITWVIVGFIAGGRLGFVLFYQPAYYRSNPLEIPMVWQGGMSFHGGFLGVCLAVIFTARKYDIPLMQIADTAAIATPIGILFGRTANFINAELWGRPTDVPWGVIFPGARAQFCPGVEGPCARHPSQLYEGALEGILLGLILWWLATRGGGLKRPGGVTGVFFAGYGAARFFVEFFRQADPQYITSDNPWGHVIRLGEAGLTMGQLLSLPMLITGLAVIFWARRRA